MSTLLAVFGIVAILAVMLLVIVFLIGMAFRIIYWAAYSASRGIHDGWNPPPTTEDLENERLRKEHRRAQWREVRSYVGQEAKKAIWSELVD